MGGTAETGKPESIRGELIDPALLMGGFAEYACPSVGCETQYDFANLVLTGLEQYKGQEERLNNFRLLRKVKDKLKPITEIEMSRNMLVFTDQLCRRTEENGWIVPEIVKEEFTPKVVEMIEGSAVGKVIVRRAFRKPGATEYPSGPTLNGSTTPAEVWHDIEELMKLGRGRHKHNAEINVIAYSMDDSGRLENAELNLRGNLPFGGIGMIHHVQDEVVVVKVRAVLGDNAAASNDIGAPKDEYLVVCYPDGRTEVIEERRPYKDAVYLQRKNPPEGVDAELVAGEDGKDSRWYRVPLETVGDRRVLSDDQLRQIGLVVKGLRDVGGGEYRVEFSSGEMSDGTTRLVFNECSQQKAMIDLREGIGDQQLGEGFVEAIINDFRGVEYFKKLWSKWREAESENERVVVLGPELSREGSAQSGTFARFVEALNQCPVPLTIIYGGLSDEHKIRQLITEGGRHIAHAVDPTLLVQIDTGNYVEIWDQMGIKSMRVKEQTSPEKRQYRRLQPRVRGLAQLVGIHDEFLIGGKVEPLLSLQTEGFLVPETYVISGKYMEEVLRGINPKIYNLLWKNMAGFDEGQLRTALEIIQGSLVAASRFPQAKWANVVARPIIRAFGGRENNDQQLIVRSDALGEDKLQHPFAGKLESFGFVPLDQGKLWNSYMGVLISYFNPDLAGYIMEIPQKAREALLKRYGGPVAVQEMIRAEASGVVMSMDQTGDPRVNKNVMVISADLGAMGVVGGLSEKRSIEIRVDHVKRMTISVVMRENGSSNIISPHEYGLMTPENGFTRRDVVLFPGERNQIVGIVRRIVEHFENPQDVEFAIGNGVRTQLWRDGVSIPRNGLYITQARPLPKRA